MSTFWDLFKESVIIQGVMTLALWGAVIYLALTGQPIPELLSTGAVAILGFWFGSKTTAIATKKPE